MLGLFIVYTYTYTYARIHMHVYIYVYTYKVRLEATLLHLFLLQHRMRLSFQSWLYGVRQSILPLRTSGSLHDLSGPALLSATSASRVNSQHSSRLGSEPCDLLL